MVDRTLSLNEGSITFPNFQVDSWYWQVYVNSRYFDNDKPLRDFTDDELQQLLYGTGPKDKTGDFSQSYEGLVAGHDGGQVIFEGPPAALAEATHSLTGQHLRKRLAG